MTSYANPQDGKDLYEGTAGKEHTHDYHGQLLTHTHPGGGQPHGFYQHTEDDHAGPLAVQQLLTEIRFQDSRDYPDGGSTLVTSRGHGETHTEFALADLLELRRLADARIAELQGRR